MCDYSLNHYPNRLAREGEKLVTHRFSSGCVGLVAACSPEAQRGRFWFFTRNPFRDTLEGASDCAVCVPPGAKLRTLDGQIVTFTQLSLEEGTFRDAVIFPSGKAHRLHELNVGFVLEVLSLDLVPQPAVRTDLGAVTAERWPG